MPLGACQAERSRFSADCGTGRLARILRPGSAEIRLKNGTSSLELATMTTLRSGSKAMALARSLPPVAIVAVIALLLRSTTLMVKSPSLTHSSAPPRTITRPFGPDALPLLRHADKAGDAGDVFVGLGVEDDDRLVVLVGEIAEPGRLIDRRARRSSRSACRGFRCVATCLKVWASADAANANATAVASKQPFHRQPPLIRDNST